MKMKSDSKCGVHKGKPATPGTRHLVLEKRGWLGVDKNNKKVVAPKSLSRSKNNSGGRNNTGRITVRFRGGGTRRDYRIIDFKRDKDGIEGIVHSFHYDPNRNTRIALIYYPDGEKRYILAPELLSLGDTIVSGEKIPYRVGCAAPLHAIPLGMLVHNIEINPGKGGVLVRSAGLQARLVSIAGDYANIKLPSGETRSILKDCRATIGVLSNAAHSLRREGKAGRRRYVGHRPHVRGAAMNSKDHPRGGGEGKHGGHLAYSVWGWESKGTKTRSPRKPSSKFIVQSRSQYKARRKN